MRIGGLLKHSLIDFPGTISCVVFLRGCNLNCPYCHNPELIDPRDTTTPDLPRDRLFHFLEQRKGLLDGVVITGGEPTLSPELPALFETIRSMGFKVKLDTNGTRPQVLQDVIERGLVDYVAMDIKTDPAAYSPVFCGKSVVKQILDGIQTLLNEDVDYEFRTTCTRPLFGPAVLAAILDHIRGARRYVLQSVRFTRLRDPAFFDQETGAFSQTEMEAFQQTAASRVQECRIR